MQKPGSKDVYLGLRKMVLQGSRERVGLAPASSPTEPWGVMMDWGLSQATATVVAFSDGQASVYLSNGGGFLGGESHESLRNAAKKMVAAAIEYQPQMHTTTEYPLPQQHGELFFYLLTDAGIFTASVSQKELSSHKHPLSELADAAQDVVTQYRLIQGS